MEKSKASYIISNGLDQSEAEMIGGEISSFLSFFLAIRHPLSKVRGTSLAKKLIKGLAILLKSLINLR